MIANVYSHASFNKTYNELVESEHQIGFTIHQLYIQLGLFHGYYSTQFNENDIFGDID